MRLEINMNFIFKQKLVALFDEAIEGDLGVDEALDAITTLAVGIVFAYIPEDKQDVCMDAVVEDLDLKLATMLRSKLRSEGKNAEDFN